MRIDQSTREGCAILAPVGELDLAAMPALRRVLLKRLAEQPVAVICDLSGLQAMDPSCAAVFTSIANHPSSSWPQTNLLVCCASPAVSAMLERLGIPQFLAVHPTVEEALAQASARPPYLRAELALGPSVMAPAAARRFVHATCWQWRLQAVGEPNDPLARRWADELVDRAMLVASANWSPTPSSTPRGCCGWSWSPGGCTWPWRMSRRGCWGWPPTRATRRRSRPGVVGGRPAGQLLGGAPSA